ncbi:hypothetical protein GE09DRAFT_124958 [Coniochaeta sp. 2T2.1]|nr:hypothetical protein GE09DRAFT_124958 [Coniochaeta sp. 2T2.1]
MQAELFAIRQACMAIFLSLSLFVGTTSRRLCCSPLHSSVRASKPSYESEEEWRGVDDVARAGWALGAGLTLEQRLARSQMIPDSGLASVTNPVTGALCVSVGLRRVQSRCSTSGSHQPQSSFICHLLREPRLAIGGNKARALHSQARYLL